MTYPIEVAGLKRELPICKVTDDLYIGAFICFGDAELTEACARELLKLVPADSYDYIFTAEAKSIPLIHEMARQSGAKKYFIARKGPKVYMPDPIHVEDQSITTAGVQKLFLRRLPEGHGGTGSKGWRHRYRQDCRSGRGRRGGPHRYQVPGQAAGVQCRRHCERLTLYTLCENKKSCIERMLCAAFLHVQRIRIRPRPAEMRMTLKMLILYFSSRISPATPINTAV